MYSLLPFKCLRWSVALGDLTRAMGWGSFSVHSFFSLHWSQAAGSAAPWAPRAVRKQLCHQHDHMNATASQARHSLWASIGEPRPNTPGSWLQGKVPQPVPVQSDQMPLTSPSLTPSYQEPAATLQTGWMTLPFLAVGPAHSISKCSWLQNPRVSHLHSQPEI